uniref:Uncharacterized protein n=1 Tax=Trichogramma kaykai TaxID=54128 RepID=A0ABD2VZ56_9HYME
MAAEEDDRSGVTTPKASQQERSAGGRGNGPSSTRRNRAHEGSGRETPAVRGAVTRESCATVNRPGRWPTPNGSRRPTRGEVHDGDAGHDAATACQRPRPPTSRITRKPTSR